MKKKYETPEFEIDKFNSFASVLTLSDPNGQGGGDEEIEF